MSFEQLVTLINIFKWPCVVLVIVIFFFILLRKQFRDLIDRFNRFKGLGVMLEETTQEANFERNYEIDQSTKEKIKLDKPANIYQLGNLLLLSEAYLAVMKD